MSPARSRTTPTCPARTFSSSTRLRRRSSGWRSRPSCSSSKTPLGRPPDARVVAAPAAASAARPPLVVATLRDDEFIGERGELIEHLAPRANTTTVRLDGFGDLEVRGARSAPPRRPRRCRRSSTRRPRCTTSPVATRTTCASSCGSSTRSPRSSTAKVGSRRRWRRSRPRACGHSSAAGSSGSPLRAARCSTRPRCSAVTSPSICSRACAAYRTSRVRRVEESLAARLLVEDFGDVDGYLFPHMLTRNAVYAAITPDRRMLLHQRAGEALEQSDVMTPRRCVDLARHFGEAAPLSGSTRKRPSTRSAPATTRPRVSCSPRRRVGTSRRCAARRAAGRAGRGPGRILLALGRAYANDATARARARGVQRRGRARAAWPAMPRCSPTSRWRPNGQWISVAELRRSALPLLEEALGAYRRRRPRPPGPDPQRDRVGHLLQRPRPRR